MSEENKALVRRFVEEAVNKGNLTILDELVASDYVYHGPNGPQFRGPEGYKQLVTMYRTAFPDLRMTTEDMVAEGDKVVTRFSAQGTHRGELMGIAPTGKPVAVTGIFILRFANRKFVEEWENFDTLGMMQQLGVIPAPAEQAAR